MAVSKQILNKKPPGNGGFVNWLGLEPRALPIKIGMLYQQSYPINAIIYFRDFCFLMYASRCFASDKFSNCSL